MNSPKEVAQNYINIGIGKMKLSTGRMFVLAVLAGMFIALAGVGAAVASATIANASIAKLVGALVFPTGLAMVLLAGSELFTGNNLLIIPVLEKQAKVTAMLRSWIIVYIGNFVGSLLIAFLAVYGGVFDAFSNVAAAAVIKAATAKVSMGWLDAFSRGILCNFLVCIAVWMGFAAKDVVGKIAGLYLPIMLFVVAGFEHSIANMYYISAGLLAAKFPSYAAAATEAGVNLSKLSWSAMFTSNLIPVTIGNMVGGVVMVGIAYWYIYLKQDKKLTKNK